MEELIEAIHLTEQSQDYTSLLENMNTYLSAVLESNKRLTDSVSISLVDKDFLQDIKDVVNSGAVGVYFGQSLRSIKVVIPDDFGLRYHEIFIQYEAPKKLIIRNVHLPNSSKLNSEYRSIHDVIETCSKYINELTRYFDELEHIDQFCSIMEPVNPSFKDDFRRIFFDDRTWLHVEVTPEGLASNVHLVGHSTYWHNKLQSGLLTWDHDKRIVENIMDIFDLGMFPQANSQSKTEGDVEKQTEEPLVCGICLCSELPDAPGIPQPLCQNAICGVHYHRSCLYQWLVACAGSRPPAFGVANGTCPTCLQPIICSEKDN
ncbi:unnamed protein product [Arctia plantaginis]|uniref:E3 ubiquitin-protein ligase FANCL n=1 Tax=Arctia plantaginis TaxID=874455 RepID=A0A8S1AT81_ARCPL|nr:unnamed protein product [Arctia plantaginis]CAB3259862.1 unnamed protein product [Arctia plantaginis]